MSNKTNQELFWTSDFGKQYTNRNTRLGKEWDEFYISNYGLTKLEMNDSFLTDIDRSANILEVGCNTGMQLIGLQKMGFHNLYGIELQQYAVEKAKQHTININIIQGSGFDIPFKDEYFDVVCTNGVLIHISPDDLGRIMDEMYRCSKKYIWGFEYYSSTLKSIDYRGNEGFLWKANYAQLFLERFPSLSLVKAKEYPFIINTEQGNVDCMYLLEKK